MDERVKEQLIMSTMLLTVENIINRLDAIADGFALQVAKNEKHFSDMKEQCLRDIIKERVELEMEKNSKISRNKNNSNKTGWVIHS
jgi:predicted FMN-binding regulatory protein PaiB